MKKKTYPPEREQLLAFRIVNAIVASPLLEDEKKLLALEDLRQMYSDPEYFKKVTPSCESYGSTVSFNHGWRESKLGYDFWSRISRIIGKV